MLSSRLRRPIRGADPIRTYYATSAVARFCYTLSFTVNLVYMVSTLGLSPFELVLVGTVLEGSGWSASGS
jgi:hypothetical protein